MNKGVEQAGQETLQVLHKHPCWINPTLETPVELNVVWNYGQNQIFYLQPNM